MPSAPWISSQTFAEQASISVQTARRVLRTALDGDCWRGAQLKVRRRLGRGGRGGLIYEVAADSLPREIASSVEPGPTDPGLSSGPLPGARRQDARVLERLDVINPILKTTPTSAARAEAMELACVASGLSERTLYRWLRQYEDQGVRGLARALPRNAGQRRVYVSRDFDRAWRTQGRAEAELDAIGVELAQGLKGLWASRAEQAGSSEIRRLGEFLLREICQRDAVVLPHEAFRLSRRYVERFAHYRAVNQRRNDRKAFDDGKPRIRRDWTALAPMERVVADVKHLDVIVRRPDGSPAWPKIVAFMDAGTGRVWAHPVLLERGEGVRQEHVIEALLGMVADPAWGFPQGLYLDNGAEFGALVKIDGALQLLNEPGARTLIFARPYNASAKPIESLFARLDRYVFGLLPGYAGPNRMAQKTQSVGKPPQPFPGTWEDFSATLRDLITTYNHRPVGGLWRDRSPQAWFEEKVASGWRAARVDDASLDAAFSDADSRRLDRGVLKIGGLRYSHERLAALPHRTVVDLALPWRRGRPPLARIDGQWVYLAVDAPYPARWIDGARESSRRQTRQSAHVRALANDAPAIDPVDLKRRMARRLEAVVPQAGLTLDLGADVRARGEAVRMILEAPPGPSPAELRRARERARDEAAPMDLDASPSPSPAELRRARERARTERLERVHGRDD